jgi:NAD+ dependent glucose-6-phosphate dehydrogenase
MNERRRILITGARGSIGRCLTAGLKDRYDLRLHNRTEEAEPAGFEHVTGDLADFDAVRPMLAGVDTVIHLAANPAVSGSWESVLSDNLVSTRNVLEAARESGSRRVIFASTNHTMGMYDRDGEWPVYTTMPYRPDSLYGASKAMGEVLGRHYYDAYGLQFIALKIGWYTERLAVGRDHPILRAMWLGPRDTVNVHIGAIEAAVPFGIYYAVSDNPDRRWDITNTMVDLGYRPVDRWDVELDTEEEGHEPGEPPRRQRWPSF